MVICTRAKLTIAYFCVFVLAIVESDFTIERLQLQFNRTSGSRVCTTFTATDDNVFENDELITLLYSTFSSLGPQVVGFVLVTIVDNDGEVFFCY